MNKLPDFVVYIVLARTCKGEKFMPWNDPYDDAIGYRSRQRAEKFCRELRKALGRGNCYVQAYGPWS